MRLATITNWAYGATVALTLLSATTMLIASGAQERERDAVEQRFLLDSATETLDEDVFSLSDRARQYLNSGDATYRLLYRQEAAALRSVEGRIAHLRDAGASPSELDTLARAMGVGDGLRNEQEAAIAAHDGGDAEGARHLLFGAEYERELDRARTDVERFQYQLDQRTEAQVTDAAQSARLWKTVAEATLVTTAALFLAVLYFVFKRRVLRPVVRLSDVVGRLAAQDYETELPEIGQIDEIGDMAKAVRVFRENGLERQRLEGERATDLTMRDLLSRMTQRLQGCDTLEDLKNVVQRFSPEIALGLAGRLYLVDPARNAVVQACEWLAPRHSRSEFSPLACWALRRGLPHQPAGQRIDVPCDHLDYDDTVPNTLCLPLTAQRETFGLLYFEPLPGVDAAATTPTAYLQILAENIGLALANLRLRDALRGMAMADPLTGLANRRHLDQVLELQIADAERLGEPLGALMLDVDHFKRINDTFGHDAGDTVLRQIGQVLQQATREDGLGFRVGGEEFLLLLRNLDVARAAARGDEIRRTIAGLTIRHDGIEVGPITASFGLAMTPDHCDAGRLIPTADAALYRAKAAGRNRLEIAARRESRAVA